MPTPSDQSLYLRSYLLGQFGSEVLLCEFPYNLSQLQLPVLPVLGDYFVEDNAEGVNIGRGFGFEHYVVPISEVFDGSIHGFIGVSRDQREVFSHRVQSASIQDHLLFVEVYVVGGQTPMNNFVLVELINCLPYFYD